MRFEVMYENEYTVNLAELFIIPGWETNYHITGLLELIFKINCATLPTSIHIYLFYANQTSSKKKNTKKTQTGYKINSLQILNMFCNL